MKQRHIQILFQIHIQKFTLDARPFSSDRNPHTAEHPVTETTFSHIPPDTEHIDLRVCGDQGKPQGKRHRQEQQIDYQHNSSCSHHCSQSRKCAAEYIRQAVLPTVRHRIHDKCSGQFSQDEKRGEYQHRQHFYMQRQKIVCVQSVLLPKRQKHCRNPQNDKQKVENILNAAGSIVARRTHGKVHAGRCLYIS